MSGVVRLGIPSLSLLKSSRILAIASAMPCNCNGVLRWSSLRHFMWLSLSVSLCALSFIFDLPTGKCFFLFRICLCFSCACFSVFFFFSSCVFIDRYFFKLHDILYEFRRHCTMTVSTGDAPMGGGSCNEVPSV